MENNARKLPTQSYLRSWLDYDLRSGVFIWKKAHYSNAKLLGAFAR